MAGGHGKTAGLASVLAAVTGNTIIALAKFAGFMMSGSATLFAEVIHSLADISNQLLLLVGVKRSEKAPDKRHRYGYGQERFFWAVISACGVFFIGAGVTIYHGVTTLMADHAEVHVSMLTIGLLLLSFAIESVTFIIAYKELKSRSPSLKAAMESGDPTTLAIVFEDSIALLGIVIALVSLYLTKATGMVVWDAVGSIVVGVLLAVMAVVLININRSYLIERAMPADAKEKVMAYLQSEPIIDEVVEFKSTIVSLDEYRISFEAELDGTALLKELYADGELEQEFRSIRDKTDFVKFAAATAQRIPRVIGRHVDAIESKIRENVPEVKHIDIEIN